MSLIFTVLILSFVYILFGSCSNTEIFSGPIPKLFHGCLSSMNIPPQTRLCGNSPNAVKLKPLKHSPAQVTSRLHWTIPGISVHNVLAVNGKTNVAIANVSLYGIRFIAKITAVKPEKIEKEIRYTSSSCHVNVISIFDAFNGFPLPNYEQSRKVFQKGREIVIPLPLASKGDAFQYFMKDVRGNIFSLRRLISDVIDGLEYLHLEMKIIHSDLKPGNILVFRGSPKFPFHPHRLTFVISDLGQSFPIDEPTSCGCGTKGYQREDQTKCCHEKKPEVCSEISPSIDFFALSATLFRILDSLTEKNENLKSYVDGNYGINIEDFADLLESGFQEMVTTDINNDEEQYITEYKEYIHALKEHVFLRDSDLNLRNLLLENTNKQL